MTITFIPGSLLAFGAGWVFKQVYESLWMALLIGTGAVWLGAMIGSCVAFLLGRYVFRALSEHLAEKYRLKEAFDRALETQGLKFIFLLRLCPLVPYNVFNYAISITAVSFKDYAIGGIGMLPMVLMDIFIGTTLGSLT